MAGVSGRRRRLEALPSALERVGEIAQRARGRRCVLLLDFDGTLAPIVDRPEAARLPEAARRVLRRLAARRSVAVVSGRDLDDLRKRVDVEGLAYAGSHGFRIAMPGGEVHEHERARRFLPDLDHAEDALRRTLEGAPGVEVERKRFAVAVHYRRAPERWADDVERAVDAVLAADHGLYKRPGREIVELLPDLDWDKGHAVRWILDALGLGPGEAFPLYVGDDVSDEDAFREVERDGLGIAVRGRRDGTRARYALEDPAAVRRFLGALDRRLEAP